jgi:hypothetical protein
MEVASCMLTATEIVDYFHGVLLHGLLPFACVCRTRCSAVPAPAPDPRSPISTAHLLIVLKLQPAFQTLVFVS